MCASLLVVSGDASCSAPRPVATGEGRRRHAKHRFRAGAAPRQGRGGGAAQPLRARGASRRPRRRRPRSPGRAAGTRSARPPATRGRGRRRPGSSSGPTTSTEPPDASRRSVTRCPGSRRCRRSPHRAGRRGKAIARLAYDHSGRRLGAHERAGGEPRCPRRRAGPRGIRAATCAAFHGGSLLAPGTRPAGCAPRGAVAARAQYRRGAGATGCGCGGAGRRSKRTQTTRALGFQSVKISSGSDEPRARLPRPARSSGEHGVPPVLICRPSACVWRHIWDVLPTRATCTLVRAPVMR